MITHTPGPWYAERIPRSRAWRVTRNLDGARGDIANVISGLGSVDAGWDARLIAAAPRMFAVIEREASQGDAECIAIVEAINGRG